MPGLDANSDNWYAGLIGLNKAPAELANEDFFFSSESLQNYKYVGDYDPNVTITGSNVSKWFVPSTGQWVLFAQVLGKANISTFPTDYDLTKQQFSTTEWFANTKWFEGTAFSVNCNAPDSNDPHQLAWDSSKISGYFTQAGGLFTIPMLYYTTGTYDEPGGNRYSIVISALTNCMYFYGECMEEYLVLRPFVHF